MVIHAIADVANWAIEPAYWLDSSWLHTLQPAHWHLPLDLAKLGDKVIEEVDFVGGVQKTFNNFVKTGQLWAFLIGIIFGYFVKTFTSFG